MNAKSKLLSTPDLLDITSLKVFYENRLVGTLALTQDDLTAFAYSDEWLREGFSLNPLSLPLEQEVFLPRHEPFEGLFGVFNESLPDGWGWLLVDRMLRRRGIEPEALNRVARLAIVGSSGMGALTYEPEYAHSDNSTLNDLDMLAEDCAALLASAPVRNLDELFALGGSSGGARPKALTEVEGEPWIIKFPTTGDGLASGLMEYEYSLAAKSCGIPMPETRLFPSNRCSGYFGVKRFDRAATQTATGNTFSRIHMVSMGGLLETSHRVPNLDYLTLARLILRLTDDLGEVEKLYALMCFNVLAHNQDDHAKNFAMLYHAASGVWSLSPAFDLTYCTGLMGEHATTVSGKGKEVQVPDLVACGVSMGLGRKRCTSTAQNIEEVATPLVQTWQKT